MFPKALAAAAVPVAALAAAGAAAPAHAADWPERIEMCLEAAEDEGLAESGRYEARFDGGTDRRFSIELISLDDDETLYAECRFSRGRISSVEIAS